jgi:hypothetical protein
LNFFTFVSFKFQIWLSFSKLSFVRRVEVK